MHQSFPKPPRRLSERQQVRAKRALAWQLTCYAVDLRDGWRCRCCQRRVEKTLTLCPERAEHHHLIPRSRAKVLTFDAQNVVLLCCECHTKITHHELEVVGSLNAAGPLTFRRTEP